MTGASYIGELDARYSSPGAEPMPWTTVESTLNKSEIFWFISVRPDGRPHAVPLMAVWMEGALFITTGADEQKAKNLTGNPSCSLTTGCNSISSGFDVTVDGVATIEVDHELLTMLAARYEEKYGWRFTVRDGKLIGDQQNVAIVYRIDIKSVYGFGRGEVFTQTRWRLG